MIDNLKAGDRMRVLPPAGLFVLKPRGNPVTLFGGGSGVTPVLSILKTALATTARRIQLVYANRDRDSIIFRDEIDALAARYPERLTVVHRLDVESGFLDRRHRRRECAQMILLLVVFVSCMYTNFNKARDVLYPCKSRTS
jgi:3-ketosteroid 9alpha-monooxygenase subunit B